MVSSPAAQVRALHHARETNDPIVADDAIREVERTYDLLQYQIDGWCVWPLLRFPMQMALQALAPVANVHRDRFATWRLAARSVADAASFLRLRRTSILCKTFISALGEQSGSRFKDVWFDGVFGQGEALRIQTLNNPAFLARWRAALVRADITTSHIDFLAAVAQRRRPRRDVREVAESVSSALGEAFGEHAPATSWVEGKLLYFLVAKDAYRRILARVRPRWTLAVDSGEHALYAAAAEMGVHTAEFQHGYSDRYHSAYSWPSEASARRSRMPIPEQIFLYGEHARREFDFRGFWGDSLRIVGNVRIDSYRALPRRSADASTRLVVTTQGIAVDELIAFFRDFLRASSRQRLEVQFKLHPIYDNRKLEYVRAFADDPRVTVYSASEGPSTYTLLRDADYNVTISSSSHYDALGLGAQTVVLPLPSHQAARLLADDGYALFAESPAMLADITAERRRSRNEPGTEFFFRPGAVQNVRNALGLERSHAHDRHC